MPEILVVEDDRHILTLLKACLSREGYSVVTEEMAERLPAPWKKSLT